MKIITSLLSFMLLCTSVNAIAEISKSNDQQDVWMYTVIQNDSFESIYQKYLNKRSDILALSQHIQHKLTKKLQIGQVISIPVEMLRKTPTNAQVLLVYGEVAVTSALVNEKRKVNKGDVLVQGDELHTGKNSLAKLLFADGSNIDIQPNSNLNIQASYQYVGKETFVTNLKLVKGRTEVSANPAHTVGNALKIETPSAIAAVRGTQFRVGVDDDLALQETLDGQVAFSADENGVKHEVLLAKGYGSIAQKGKAPLPPIVLLAAPEVSALPNLIETYPLQFTLEPQSGTVAWVSQLSLDADFTQILNEQTTQAGSLVFDNLADGRYYLRLRAQDQYGLQGKDAIHAFSVKIRTAEPILEKIDPVNGKVKKLSE